MTATISSLWCYPIKSCRGIALETAAVGPRGILHDREYMLVDARGVMLTQRTHPRMCMIAPRPREDGTLEIAIPEQPATLARYRRGEYLGLSWKVQDAKQIYFGRNFTHTGTGTIAVGDAVRVVDPA